MENNQNETAPLIIKIGLYVLGVLIGVASKLSALNQEKKITWSISIYHTCLAAASAWVVWFSFYRAGMSDVAIAASVIAGRFGDSMLLALGKALKKAVITLLNLPE